MPAKKNMPVKEMKMNKVNNAGSSCKCSSGAWMWIGGIISILLGISVWMAWLTLAQLFGIVFVLMGIKKLFGKCHCH
jgi:hypothetical protein